LYIEEGVPFEVMKYEDNQEIIDIIENKPHGVMCSIFDEMNFP